MTLTNLILIDLKIKKISITLISYPLVEDLEIALGNIWLCVNLKYFYQKFYNNTKFYQINKGN